MPIVIVLDTSLSMLRRPQVDSNFTYFEVAQTLIESLVSFVRRHHFTEHMALVTASSRPQLRAAFSRRDGYASLMQEVLGVGVEDKANYLRSITVAHNAALSEFGAGEGITTNIIFLTDEGALLHGIPTAEEEKIAVEGLPFYFPGNLYILSLQGKEQIGPGRCPFERLVELNEDRGRVVYLPCATSVPTLLARAQWPRLFPAQYGQLRCGWLHADVQSHPPIRPGANGRFTVKVAGFVTPDDVSSPAVLSRHLLLPVVQKSSENGATEGDEEAGEVQWYPCGTTEEHWKAPQFTALLHGSLASRHYIALAEFVPASGPAPVRQFALLHSELASPTAAKRSNLTLSLLPPGIDVMQWMGKLSYLAPAADFEVAPVSPFPVKSLEPRSYSSGSGHVCWLWGNMALDVSKVMKHARHLSSASANRVKAFYSDVNRVRTAALAFGATELLVAIRNILEREVQHSTDATTKRHLSHVLNNLLLPVDKLKRIEEPGS